VPPARNILHYFILRQSLYFVSIHTFEVTSHYNTLYRLQSQMMIILIFAVLHVKTVGIYTHELFSTSEFSTLL